MVVKLSAGLFTKSKVLCENSKRSSVLEGESCGGVYLMDTQSSIQLEVEIKVVLSSKCRFCPFVFPEYCILLEQFNGYFQKPQQQ